MKQNLKAVIEDLSNRPATTEEERKDLFTRIWTITDSLKSCETMIKQHIKTAEYINNEMQETLYTYYSDLQREAEQEGKPVERMYNYHFYEQMDIQNDINNKYLHEIYEYLEEIQSDINALEKLANEL